MLHVRLHWLYYTRRVMQEHLKLGEALSPMREQGVMIVGSGLSFHNMREFVIKGRGDHKSGNIASQVSHDCHLDP